MEDRPTIILGAGLSGLSTALHLAGDYLLLEREDRVGGLTRTEDIDGFLFNHTGHWLHLRDERTKRLVDDLLPDRMSTVVRQAAIYMQGRFTAYPFQANLFGLAPVVLRECLQGAVAAAIQRAAGEGGSPRNFQEYVTQHFGEGIARHFIVPYNTKLWGVPPTEVTTAWCQRFVPIPDIAAIVDGALGMSREALGYNATFLYPSEGGIESLPKAMVARVPRDRLRLSTQPDTLSVTTRTIRIDGQQVHYGHLVSSAALPDLVAMTEDAPEAVIAAARRLRCSPLRYVNVGLAVARPLNGAHWLYLPEPKYPFYRVGSASNAVPSLAPMGRSSLYVELANDQSVPDGKVVEALAAFLLEIGTIDDARQLLFAAFRTHPWGYVIFDEHCETARRTILDFYHDHGVHSIGRYGEWTYNSMEDAILAGIQTAKAINEA